MGDMPRGWVEGLTRELEQRTWIDDLAFRLHLVRMPCSLDDGQLDRQLNMIDRQLGIITDRAGNRWANCRAETNPAELSQFVPPMSPAGYFRGVQLAMAGASTTPLPDPDKPYDPKIDRPFTIRRTWYRRWAASAPAVSAAMFVVALIAMAAGVRPTNFEVYVLAVSGAAVCWALRGMQRELERRDRVLTDLRKFVERNLKTRV